MLGGRPRRSLPGGLEGRGGLAANGVSGVACATPIRAGGAESADMSLSDRERAEGFHLTITNAVALAVTARIVASIPCTYRSRTSKVDAL